jgi:hypothetical protein
MARPVSSPNDQAATLRNLKVLVVLLIISNLVVGALSVYLLRAVDRRYSELVERSVPALNDLRELMSDTVLVMRTTNARNFSGPPDTHAAATQVIENSLGTALHFRAALATTGGFKDQADQLQAVQKTGDVFIGAVQEVKQLYAAGKISEAVRIREEKLLPAFDQHMAAIGNAADKIESLSLGVSKDYTTRTNNLSTIVLGVASWPVILLLGLLLLTAIFVLAMMVAFRGKDLADMP